MLIKNDFNNKNKKLKYKIFKILFPFYPIKVFGSISCISILACLIGISIILNNFLVIKISTGISISFAWLPTYIIGWYFGPIIGFFMGLVIDTINYLIGDGVWFWLYAIQEPLLGLIVGTISSVYFYLKSGNKSIKWTLIFNQIVILMFIIASVFIVFYYSDTNNGFFQNLMNSSSYNTIDMIKKTNEVLRWIILALLSVYFLVIETIIFIKLKKYKSSEDAHTDRIQTFLLISAMCMITSVIFSFLLGPISAIEYYKWVHNGINPPSLVKFGVVFYLVPRVIKECFKTPIYSVILAAIIFPTNMIINNIKHKLQNSYN